jgi:hypothetical protein
LNPDHGGEVSFQHAFALFNPLQRRQTDPSCVGEGAEIDTPFVTLARQGAGAFLLTSDALFVGRRDLLVALAARYKLPTMYV